MNLQMPEKAGGARMLEAMIQGKHVGRLDLHVVGDKLSFTDRGERAEIETILADHRRQLTEYDQRLGDTDPATMRDYYEQRRKEIEKAIERESALLQQLPVAITGSWFENRIIPLDATTPDQPGVAMLVDALQQGERPARGGRQARRPGHARWPTRPSPPTARLRPPARRYIGTAACGACHAPALAQWKTTKHARALSALARVGRDKDPSCVGCHVTGYLQTGGRKDIADARAHLRRMSGASRATGRAANTAPPPTSAAPSPAPSPRRPAAAATPPTSPTASSTTGSSSRPSSDRGTRWRPGPRVLYSTRHG